MIHLPTAMLNEQNARRIRPIPPSSPRARPSPSVGIMNQVARLVARVTILLFATILITSSVTIGLALMIAVCCIGLIALSKKLASLAEALLHP